MFCTNCGNEVGNGNRFCPFCGQAVVSAKPVCPGCGQEIKPGSKFCTACGRSLTPSAQPTQQYAAPNQQYVPNQQYAMPNQSYGAPKAPRQSAPVYLNPTTTWQKIVNFMWEDIRCLPAFIIGIVGSLFGMMGGICMTMCSIFDSNAAFFMLFGGSLISMLGTCFCFKKTRVGSPLLTIGTLMVIIRAYSEGGEFMTVFGIVLMVTATLISAVFCIPFKKFFQK